MSYGEVRDVPADLARDLIKAGHAEEVKEGNNEKDKSTATVRSRKRR